MIFRKFSSVANKAEAIQRMELINRQAYGFRNFQNYRLRVKVLCS